MSTNELNACGWSSMIRPRFGPGMLLQHEDLEQIVDYTTGMYRLLFRTLLGSGIVCGLEVNFEKDKKCFSIGAGVALDCKGYVVEVPKDQMIQFEDMSSLPAFGLVLLSRKTKKCATRSVVCSDGEDEALPTRKLEGFEIEVFGMDEVKWKEAIAKCENPFTGNDCPNKCCDLPGVLLASFSIKDEVLTPGKGRRNLRVNSSVPKPVDEEPVVEPVA